MKAIIMEIEDKYLVVATKNGLFKKIRNTYSNCQLGDEIDILDRPQISDILTNLQSYRLPRHAAIPLKKIAAAFMIMFFMISGYAVADYMKPVTYVSMDVNPSIELALNRYQRVLQVKGLDSEGEEIAQKVAVKNMPVDKAIKILLNQIKTDGKEDSDINTIMFTLSNINNSIPKGLEQKLVQTTLEETQKDEKKDASGKIQAAERQESNSGQQSANRENVQKESKPVRIVVENTTIDKHREATKKQLSQGKLLLYEKIKEIKPSIKLDEIKNVPVSALVEELDRISVNLENKGQKHLKQKKEEAKYGKDQRNEQQTNKSNSNKQSNSQKDKTKDMTPFQKEKGSLNIKAFGQFKELYKNIFNEKIRAIQDKDKDESKDKNKDKDKGENNDWVKNKQKAADKKDKNRNINSSKRAKD